MRLVAIDPGGKRNTGIAAFNLTVKQVGAKLVPVERVWRMLVQLAPNYVAIERFFLYPHAARFMTFHKMPASETIGVVKEWARQNNVSLDEVVPSHARRFESEAMKIKNLRSHRLDALCVGLYWLKHKVPPELVEMTQKIGPWEYDEGLLEWEDKRG